MKTEIIYKKSTRLRYYEDVKSYMQKGAFVLLVLAVIIIIVLES